MKPIPPVSAIAMAIPASVTVSMGEETSGVFRVIFLVRAEVRSTWSAVKSIYPGRMRKSLKGRGNGSKGQDYSSLKHHPQ